MDSDSDSDSDVYIIYFLFLSSFRMVWQTWASMIGRGPGNTQILKSHKKYNDNFVSLQWNSTHHVMPKKILDSIYVKDSLIYNVKVT